MSEGGERKDETDRVHAEVVGTGIEDKVRDEMPKGYLFLSVITRVISCFESTGMHRGSRGLGVTSNQRHLAQISLQLSHRLNLYVPFLVSKMEMFELE